MLVGTRYLLRSLRIQRTLPTSAFFVDFVQEIIRMLRNFFAREEGQGLVEYALILVLIAIVVIAVLTLLGQDVEQVFSSIESGL